MTIEIPASKPRPVLPRARPRTVSACSLCYTCGGDWPVFSGVIPTRSGFHVTCGENPWNKPEHGLHVGELMETYGGGGHRAVGGANPENLQAARTIAAEVAEKLVSTLAQVG